MLNNKTRNLNIYADDNNISTTPKEFKDFTPIPKKATFSD